MRSIILYIACFAILLSYCHADNTSRAEKLKGLGKVIFNNDGCDIGGYSANKPFSVKHFLNLRTTPLTDTDVETIIYCPTSAGFSNFSYNTKVGSTMYDNIRLGYGLTRLKEMDSDPLKEVIKCAHKNKLMAFCSFRINDSRHDSAYRPTAKPAKNDFVGRYVHSIFPPLKKKHPEYLVGSWNKRPPYGIWSAVDYTQKPIRDLCAAFVEEVCNNYEVDGIELDFCRDPVYFKSVCLGQKASAKEKNMMTNMLRLIRKYADKAGKLRKRPILIAIRVPDSVAYCEDIGIDLERWLKEGLVDILIGGSELRLNPWSYWAALGKKYPGVKTYACMTDAWIPRGQNPLLTRNRNTMAFRAQAAAAYAQGIDGIYSYNEYIPGSLEARYLKEIGDARKLANKNKLYFFAYSHNTPGRFLKGGARYRNVPILTPNAPLKVSRKGKTLDLFLGKEAKDGEAELLLCGPALNPKQLRISFNGKNLTQSRLLKDVLAFKVPFALLKPGKNVVAFYGSESPRTTILKGDEVLIFGSNQGLWRRLYDGGSPEQEKIENGGYYLPDNSTAKSYNLIYPWQADPDGKINAEFEMQFVKSTAPDAVCVRIANGRFCEYLQFYPDKIVLKYAGDKYAMATEDKFHKYSIDIDNNLLKIKVDGKDVFKTKLFKPFNSDAAVIPGNSKDRTEYMASNSLLLGSLSNAGVGGARWRNVSLKSNAQLVEDAALLVIHDSSAREVQIYKDSKPLLNDLKGKGEVIAEYHGSSGKLPAGGWKMVYSFPSNTKLEKGLLCFNNSINGPTCNHVMKKDDFDGIFEFSVVARLSSEEFKPQLQLVAVAPEAGKNSMLSSFRLGYRSASFLDNKPERAQAGKDGFYHLKMLFAPATGRTELYINGEKHPLLRCMAITVPQRKLGFYFGDGSSGIKGKVEIKEAKLVKYNQK